MTFRKTIGFCMVLLLSVCACAQTPAAGAELRRQIRGLGNTLQVLQITAHPGDEDGALLMYETHAEAAQVTLLTLTRGESGDNRLAIMEPSEQGLLRTLEQQASDARYGVEQRYTRVVDFGFARTADEVFDRWGGHDTALGDVVRVIRETRPEIIVIPFDPNVSDGDGQHQAAVILAREAFRAAADTKRFPEQLSDGAEVWQAKRLFALVGSGGYSVAFNSNETGVGESESWQQQALRALVEQKSQGEMVHAPREAVRHYRLIEAAPGFAMEDGANDFADGLDVGLESLVKIAGPHADEMLKLQPRLKAMGDAANSALESMGDQADCMAQIAEYLRNLHIVEDRIVALHAPVSVRAEMEKLRTQAERALLMAAGVEVHAKLKTDGQSGYVMVPGAPFEIETGVSVSVGSRVGIRVANVELKAEGGRWQPRRDWNSGDTHAVFRGRVPSDAPFTRPQFLLDNDDDGAYRILDERNATRALPAASLEAVAEIEIAGEVVRAIVPVQARDGETERTAVVAPAMSVIVEPRMRWNRRTNFAFGEIEVRVRSNIPKLQNALLSVHAPSGWRTEPEHEVLDIQQNGEEHTYRFYLVQESGEDGTYPVSAVVRWGSAVFDQGYKIVRGPEGQIVFDYRVSTGALTSADVDIPDNIEIGYVGVAGDPTPGVLRDINVRVAELDRDELMQGRLGKYWAIVLGTHALDAREDLSEARARLLEYAEQGGVLVILGQSDAQRFASNAPVPYPVEVGSAMVSNEASRVELVDDHDDVFWDPNEIHDDDFRGWSEERGRYFAKAWDAHFESLIKMNDPGQPVQEGALIRCRYGRGYVIYSGLSFDRQIQAGVPGAMRLLVNMLSPGAELHR